jgi:hypothetical protein
MSVERSAKLFVEGVSRSQIGKAPTIISLAVPPKWTSMSQLNVSRFVKLHDLAAQRNIQSGGRDWDLNMIRVSSLVCYRFGAAEGRVLRGRFHASVPFL